MGFLVASMIVMGPLWEPQRDLCVELRWLLSQDSEMSVEQRESRVKHCYEMEREFRSSVIIKE